MKFTIFLFLILLACSSAEGGGGRGGGRSRSRSRSRSGGRSSSSRSASYRKTLALYESYGGSNTRFLNCECINQIRPSILCSDGTTHSDCSLSALLMHSKLERRVELGMEWGVLDLTNLCRITRPSRH